MDKSCIFALKINKLHKMTYYKRNIDIKLMEWKASQRRKPLLIRGARQVGKTSAVRHLGKEFKYFVEINLESLSMLTKNRKMPFAT